MGYREDLIERLQKNGLWNDLTAEQQKRFENLTDEQARRMMVVDDEWNMGSDEAVGVFGLMSLVQMIGLFNGALVERQGENAGKLSKAGRLLAEFFIEMREQGLAADDVDACLRNLSPLVIAALITVYKRSS